MRSLLYSGKHGIVSLILFFFLFMAGQVRAQAQPSPGQGYQYPEFSPSMAIIVVILIAAMFFMGFFSVYIRYCSSSVPSNNSVLPLAGRSRRVTARGLDLDVILTFPIFPYSDVKELKIGKGALECAVCLNEFEEDETLRLIPKCDHVFHPECIDEWLSSHTTCPVCRANLTPQPGEPLPQVPELTRASAPPSDDVEAQVNDGNNAETQQEEEAQQRQRQEESKNNASGSLSVHVEVPEVININMALNRNRTRGSGSGRPRKFPRSHSTGHSLVQPGENTDRFTLRLPADVRKQIMNRELNRASSFALTSLPREGSSRRGYRGEGSGRGRSPRWLGRSDRWVFSMAPPFFSRTGSLKSPKVAAGDCESSSVRSNGPGNSFNDPSRPPV